MMKKLILSLTLVFTFGCINATDVCIDSLKQYIVNDNNIYITLARKNVGYWDFTKHKDSAVVKEYILQLLDVNKYIDFQLQRYNTYLQEGDLSVYLNRNFNRSYIDSVYRTPNLLQYYSDLLRDSVKKKSTFDFYHDKNSYSWKITNILPLFRTPEVYDLIVNNLKVNEDSKLFKCLLLRMQDPKEWEKLLSNYDEERKKDFYKDEVFYDPFWYGSFSVKLYETALGRQDSSILENRKPVPYNIETLRCPLPMSEFLNDSDDPIIQYLYRSIFGEKMEYIPSQFHYNYPIYKMSYKELQELSDYVVKNKEHFIKALEPLKEKYDKENEWWRSKITYRK